MPACPRCDATLDQRGRGILGDPHGVFVPRSALARQVDASAVATMNAALAGGATSTLACPSCRGAMREARVELPGSMPVLLDGCLDCGGWWMDRGELDRLRAAVLARPREKPRAVGGYGRTSTSRDSRWRKAEALLGIIELLGAFLPG